MPRSASISDDCRPNRGKISTGMGNYVILRNFTLFKLYVKQMSKFCVKPVYLNESPKTNIYNKVYCI